MRPVTPCKLGGKGCLGREGGPGAERGCSRQQDPPKGQKIAAERSDSLSDDPREPQNRLCLQH